MAFALHGGRSALEPLEATRQDFGPPSVRGSTVRAPGDFSSAREGLRTAGTMRGNAQLGATSNVRHEDVHALAHISKSAMHNPMLHTTDAGTACSQLIAHVCHWLARARVVTDRAVAWWDAARPLAAFAVLCFS